MSIRSLDRIFAPTSVAVVGATDRQGSVGRAVLQNLMASRFNGPILPVNPRHPTLLGLKTYRRLTDLPLTPDLVVVCTPKETIPAIIDDCGRIGAVGLVILSAGFAEAGAEGHGLEQEIRRQLAQYPGMRMVGPNCLGILVPRLGLNASFAADMPADGGLAFVSQSGALCTSVLDWSIQKRIGFSHFVSIGNMVDVDFGDLIDYLGADDGTRALLLYVESITNARKFISAARAFSRNKPIIAYKGGRFAASARAAASHTGAMAGDDAVYDAALRRAGIERVHSVNDLFDCAALLARDLPRSGPRLAIITNAGGLGVVATDALLAHGGTLATLSPASLEALNRLLPPLWSHGNPVDVLGDASADRLSQALHIALSDDEVDAALVTLAPQAMTDPLQSARAVIEEAERTTKPVLTAWMGGARMDESMRVFESVNVPAYRQVEDAIDAFVHLVSYSHNLELLYETPQDVRLEFEDQSRMQTLRPASDDGSGGRTLSEHQAKALLKAYGIRVAETRVARSASEAAGLAEEIGYPVALKVLSPQITHKTDVGGIALSLVDRVAVQAAFVAITESAARSRPDATIEGVTVQRMVKTTAAVELIAGAKRDATFGTVVVVGAGGTLAELLSDRVIELPPLNERLARRMLESLRIWPVLSGYRGQHAADIDDLIETLIRFSYLLAEHPEIAEMDVNPLLAGPDGAVALDARIVLADAPAEPGRPFHHLAIRPYPEEFDTTITLRDGTAARLRAIRPEDEPRWHDLLGRCSQESLWFRLGSLIKHTTHKMATRYCFIDYDREIAIVVEIDRDGTRELIGVGRLVADADHDTAEYAILIRDDWQGQGLGTALTDYCLQVARRWGVRRVVAYTLSRNRRMLRVFEGLGFHLEPVHNHEWMVATTEVAARTFALGR